MSWLDRFADPPPKAESEVLRELDRGRVEDLNYAEGPKWGGAPVGPSKDLSRVLAIPRRKPPTGIDLVTKWSEVLRKPLGYQSLRPVQAAALEEMHTTAGMFGPIGIGYGKTLLDILAPMVVPSCKVAVLLIPPELRAQFFNHDWDFYGKHWELPNLAGGRYFKPNRPMLHVVAYSGLSTAKNTDLLDRIAPDLIIADEAQNLKARNASRTKRFLRYFHTHPDTRFCAWSGTMTKRSIKDFAHLSALALKQNSPMPLHYPTVIEWARALDPGDYVAPAGALARLCEPGESVRHGMRRRMKETLGWVATTEKSIDTPLVMRERPVTVPPEIHAHLAKIKDDWTRPDGKRFSQALDVARCAREMACGFYYRWTFPRGEPEALVDEWKVRRADWNAELRDKLKLGRVHMDSPLLCANAAIRFYDGYDGPLPVWEALTWPAWVAIRDRVKPETEPVWINDFLARDAAEWAKENVGIVWYEHASFGERVAQLSGAKFYGPGEEASAQIINELGDRSIVASVRAHGTGKNLQMFNKQIVANPPSDGGTWEQMLGRTHRPGQEASEVLVEVYRHVEQMVAAVAKAHSLAIYIEDILETSQRLNIVQALGRDTNLTF